MGSLIRCHKKKARQPYYVEGIHKNIFTIEELCYFLSHNLYLVDYTIMDERLCDWISKELELFELAKDLKRLLEERAGVETFVMQVLSYGSIYTTAELAKIQQVLEKLKNQKAVEKKKLKADTLLANGSISQAIRIYKSILSEEKDESVERKFYGHVYANLGAAYGRMFLYQEAAKMYLQAFQICEKTYMLQAYLYACRNCLTAEEYQKLLMKNEVYLKLDEQIVMEIQDVKEQDLGSLDSSVIEEWKDTYRKIAF